MTLLSIDTSTRACSVALTIGGVPVATHLDRTDGNHARLLPVFIEQLLKEAAQRGLQPEAVVLSEGPGSYTGLRIATSTAKGLCYGMQIPLITLPTPLVLAASFAATQEVTNPCAVLCPMIDARRMEVYTAQYDANLCARSEVEAKVIDSGSFADLLTEHEMYFFGDGAMKCAETISSEHAHFIDGIVPDAQHMGLLVENGMGRRIEGTEIAYYDPMYLKEFVAAPSHVKGLA